MAVGASCEGRWQAPPAPWPNGGQSSGGGPARASAPLCSELGQEATGHRQDAQPGQRRAPSVWARPQTTQIAFLGAAVVFPHFGSKGTKGLFSSWTASWVIFRNKFQRSCVLLRESERRVTLPWLWEAGPACSQTSAPGGHSSSPTREGPGSCSVPRGSAGQEAGKHQPTQAVTPGHPTWPRP